MHNVYSWTTFVHTLKRTEWESTNIPNPYKTPASVGGKLVKLRPYTGHVSLTVLPHFWGHHWADIQDPWRFLLTGPGSTRAPGQNTFSKNTFLQKTFSKTPEYLTPFYKNTFRTVDLLTKYLLKKHLPTIIPSEKISSFHNTFLPQHLLSKIPSFHNTFFP